MREAHVEVLKDQGRGVAGALLVVGLASVYTVETWWLGRGLPMGYLVMYAFVGLGVIFLVAHHVGFRQEDSGGGDRPDWRTLTDFAELLLQSFATAYLVLLLFGILRLDHDPVVAVRLGLIQVVPLGFGAALANLALRGADETSEETLFPQNVAIFALGALFFTLPVAPTQETEILASHVGWPRAVLVIVATLLFSYLVLYELGFRGERARVEQRSKEYQIGTVFVAYAVGATVSAVLLVAFGHFQDTTLVELVKQTIVLTFVAVIGASAGTVVL